MTQVYHSTLITGGQLLSNPQFPAKMWPVIKEPNDVWIGKTCRANKSELGKSNELNLRKIWIGQIMNQIIQLVWFVLFVRPNITSITNIQINIHPNLVNRTNIDLYIHNICPDLPDLPMIHKIRIKDLIYESSESRSESNQPPDSPDSWGRILANRTN